MTSFRLGSFIDDSAGFRPLKSDSTEDPARDSIACPLRLFPFRGKLNRHHYCVTFRKEVTRASWQIFVIEISRPLLIPFGF